jgi:hypothetical protein
MIAFHSKGLDFFIVVEKAFVSRRIALSNESYFLGISLVCRVLEYISTYILAHSCITLAIFRMRRASAPVVMDGRQMLILWGSCRPVI